MSDSRYELMPTDSESGGLSHGNQGIAVLMSFFVSILVAAFARQTVAWIAERGELIESTQYAETSDVPRWLIIASAAFFIVPFVFFYQYYRRVGHRLEVERRKAATGQPNHAGAAMLVYGLPYIVVLPLMLVFMVLVL